MTRVVTSHTADLDAATLAAGRALLEEVFAKDFTPEDWTHSLGGIHALAYDGDRLIGHAAVVLRRLINDGRILRAGYIEGVAVLVDRQRRGVGGAMMDAIERIVRDGYELGALAASKAGVALYRSHGWQQWQGPTSSLTPDGVARTPQEDGTIWVLPVTAELDLSGELTCDWREGDVW
jgi:aminoglycoside 2'-N-acetyltransferase I